MLCNNKEKNILLSLVIIIVSFMVLRYIIKKWNKKRKEKNLLKEYLKDVDNIYKVGAHISATNNVMGEYNLTYGDLTNDGVKNIVKFLDKINHPKKCFIDLGCGNGRAMVYAILNGFDKAKGVEIYKERYDYSINAINKLHTDIKDKIKIENKDLFTVEEDYIPDDSVVFVSNLLYPEQTTQNLVEFINKITKKNIILILSRKPDNLYDFKLVEQLEVPMSWNKKQNNYILQKK